MNLLRIAILSSVVPGVISVGGTARASLMTHLENSNLVPDAIVSVESPTQQADRAMNSSTSTRTSAIVFEFPERVRTPHQQYVLGQKATSPVAGTPASPDGGLDAPVLYGHALLLPGDFNAGPVVAYKTVIPPDPPPTGLLKPPREPI